MQLFSKFIIFGKKTLQAVSTWIGFCWHVGFVQWLDSHRALDETVFRLVNAWCFPNAKSSPKIKIRISHYYVKTKYLWVLPVTNMISPIAAEQPGVLLFGRKNKKERTTIPKYGRKRDWPTFWRISRLGLRDEKWILADTRSQLNFFSKFQFFCTICTPRASTRS